MRIRTKMMILSLGGMAATVATLLGILEFRKGSLGTELKRELDVQARAQCAAVAKDVHTMLTVQNASITKKLHSDLSVARDVLNRNGTVSVSEETTTWHAINQYNKTAHQIELPRFCVGDKWLGQNQKLSVESPVVDEVKNLVGSTCTVFQRMNKTGDMLRVCTNVEKTDGSRAIGTYIPATNPDGTANPVVSTVLRGETYTGRAYVVNDWYVTSYEPIYDSNKEIVGILYVGVKQENVEELRQGIMNIVAGKTGYVYILGGSEGQRGDYIVSHGGKRDGENIWGAKDAEGNLFIQSIIAKALATKEGECDFERYPWQNEGETEPRWKIAAVNYFQPWDWVIGVALMKAIFMKPEAASPQL